MLRIAVGDIMTRNFVHVKPADSLYECARKIVKERVDSLLVSEGSKLLGILTARDILWAITKNPKIELKSVRAIDIATRKVAVIKPSADISQAIKKMSLLNFRRLPVLSNGALIGVVTLKDILAIEPSLYSEMNSFLDVREKERKLGEAESSWPQEGFCDNCGAFSELLKVDGKLLCMDCREEMY